MIHRTTPRAAYVHVPFCARRCGYCNFSVIAGRDDLADQYLDALAAELSLLGMPHEVDTLYVGGGTPTRLSPVQIERLCAMLREWFPLAAGHEWTIEANPEDLDAERVALLASAGVNRVSLGAQSFDAAKLERLERCHSAADTERCVALADARGMDVALDLIFAAPGETLPVWLSDLQAALRLGVEHISTYGLTFEKGTRFWTLLQKEDLRQAPEELERQMYEATIDMLAAAGMEHYEVSNFALPGHRSRHNRCTGRAVRTWPPEAGRRGTWAGCVRPTTAARPPTSAACSRAASPSPNRNNSPKSSGLASSWSSR